MWERTLIWLTMLADYGYEETAEILKVTAIAVGALSALSTFKKEIMKAGTQKTCVPRHNSVLSG